MTVHSFARHQNLDTQNFGLPKIFRLTEEDALFAGETHMPYSYWYYAIDSRRKPSFSYVKRAL